VLPFWELGAYVQGAVRTDDGRTEWAGVKLRSKFVTPPGWNPRWRLGINIEVSYLPAVYEADRWGSELRPIVAWQDEAWLFAFNPILDQSLAGRGESDGPSFQPALKVARTVGPLAVGLEYYATIGPLTSSLPLRLQEHYVYEVVDVLAFKRWEINAGVGEGLTDASAGLVLKMILGYAWDPEGKPPSPVVMRPAARGGSL
jgi:hypothetical protein